MGRKRKTFEQRCVEFWERIDRGDASACWIWRGATNSRSGYGNYTHDGRVLHAHRFAWMIVHGRESIPADAVVRHRCDNPPCVNPAHLEVGTQADNMQDKVRRGRCGSARGEAVGNAKLTADKVREIRRLHRADIGVVDLAAAYGVSHHAIHCVVERKTWKHVL